MLRFPTPWRRWRDDDALRKEDLKLIGGSWSGLLFENPNVGYPLSLTWDFDLSFAEVTRSYGDISPNLVVGWVPLGPPSWQRMEGQTASGKTFGDPIESSVYFFDHHRFNAANVTVVDQNGPAIRVQFGLAGDIDGLGIDSLKFDAWLEFSGIYVHPEERLHSVEDAELVLANFTDPAGLVGIDNGHNYLFRPA